MSAVDDPSLASVLARGAAEAALLVAWCATMSDAEVVRPAAYVVATVPDVAGSEHEAAACVGLACIEALIRAPKPVFVAAQPDGRRVRVTATRDLPPAPEDRDARRAHDLTVRRTGFLAQMAEHALAPAISGMVLLVGGLERLRVPAAALRVLATDYRLDVPWCASGGRIDDPSTRGLHLDPAVTGGADVVILLGRSAAGASRRIIAFDPPIDTAACTDSACGPA